MIFRPEGAEVVVRLYDRHGAWVGLRVVDAAAPPDAVVVEKVRYVLRGPRYVEGD